MLRSRVRSPRADKRFFRITADRSRSVNTSVTVPRGGIRF